MQKRSSKGRQRDEDEIAADLLRQVTGGAGHPMERRKDPLAVELGRRGGLKGGKARAAKLSKARRAAIAKKAARARWRAGRGK